ncbi:hypothetical protein M2451_003521 [Dysgonomonas sp. PFB1-18]|uniref:DUF6340 family protein n=1 Tax=unclassified Dysgonomonas TaxID=2630389 RepID=UPI002473E9CC|nr:MULTISPECIES: DUF6340 family protein [unclassified Dysgonomonas]MDH6310712.1 hypothetical protein [Dysgonomonas sp. PF1-14]MDH6340563.1 hypothetical protein [Dysgonomonas sp. PF1-16]MDH6382181.1 hypothetical protein [Dysgonomonas sp. PFB1-18]MDH6399524.1 hypothetical protein [Dysgonomonas sp. PF1-23]
MKYIYINIIAAILLSSCASSINFISIDTLEPAEVTFAPEVTNVVIVDNSPLGDTEDAEEDSNNKKGQTGTSILSMDSVRTIMLNSLQQFMGEENYFTKVSLHPYRTNSKVSFEDVRPLSPRKVQSICNNTKADALIALDLFVMTARIESENTYYFNNYNFLSAKLGTVLRVYTKDGREVMPIAYVDSLFSEGGAQWDIRRNNIHEINTLITDMSIIGADRLTGKFIPSWKSHERWYYVDGSSSMKEAEALVKAGKWKEASDIWEGLYSTEKNAGKRAKIASNVALAQECLDNIERAVSWIKTAFDELPQSSKSELALKIIAYREDLIKRYKGTPKLKEQLGVDNFGNINGDEVYDSE